MKRIIFSLTLGFLTFFLIFYLLGGESSEKARVLSTSNSGSTHDDERLNPMKSDRIETAPFNQKANQVVKTTEVSMEGMIPSKIEIPAINVEASVQSLGYTEEGGMAVPNNLTDVGWFEPGTKPGNQGNAVIAGHVDGNSGPAVFYDLKKLSIGDEIIISDSTGNTLTFTVNKIESYPYENAPIRELFGPSNNQSLNLITCTGSYDDQASTYSERLAIYTELSKRQER